MKSPQLIYSFLLAFTFVSSAFIGTTPLIAQAPDLGAASGFAVFTGVGALSNDGTTVINGDIGTNAGAFSGFPPGIVNGDIHVQNTESAAAATATNNAFAELATRTCGQVIGTTLGGGQVLTPDVYCLGAASTLNGVLTLDAQGDPDAIFIFKIDGALSTGSFASVELINGASYCNVYWRINGAFSLGPGSVFQGTALVGGTISLFDASSVFGRILATTGAIDLHNTIVTIGGQVAAPTITANGPVAFCEGDSVILSGNIGGVWNTGETTASITVDSSGLYFVVVGSCEGDTSNIIEVTVFPSLECTIVGEPEICFGGGSTELCMSGIAASFEWSTGEITSCITVDLAGDYSITVTTAEGCVSTCSVTVVELPEVNCTISGELAICAGGSTELCVPDGLGEYLWSTGDTTNCITVDIAGDFSVTITSDVGCVSTCSVLVSEEPIATCTIVGVPEICFGGGSTELCVSGIAASFEWSTGEITSCITVDLAGDYSVTVTTAEGCVSTCSVTVVELPEVNCTISGELAICAGGSTELCVPAGLGEYLWSTGDTSNCTIVDIAGDFSVTITSDVGCVSTCSVLVTEEPIATCTIVGVPEICFGGGSTELCVSGIAASFEWSTGEITSCITVDLAGDYSVTVTTAEGCVSTCSVTVVELPEVNCEITGELAICAGGSTELCVPDGLGEYLWSTGDTTNCITVDIAGDFSVTITSDVGCVSTCSVLVTEEPIATCTIVGVPEICFGGGSTELCVSGIAASFEWSTGEITSCITVDLAGDYSVTVTTAEGCVSTCSVTVVELPEVNCTITGELAICAGGSTELCVPAGLGEYLWSTGDATNCISVDIAGDFSVTITSDVGCVSTCSVLVTEEPIATCTIVGVPEICFGGGSTELCVSGIAASFEWSTGEITSCITVDLAGDYSVTVTTAEGCVSTCSVTVVELPEVNCTISGELAICAGGSTELCVPDGLGEYLWSTGDTSNCTIVDIAGDFSVTITSDVGCVSTCSVLVTEEPIATCTIVGVPEICFGGGSTELCVSGIAASFEWSTGEITSCITVDLAGEYSVTVTTADGCVSTCSVTVVELPEVNCTITGELAMCAGGSTELCVPDGLGEYLWSTGDTTNCITVDIAGDFSVTITSDVGCVSTCSVLVTEEPIATCTIVGVPEICFGGGSTELCVSGIAASFEWSTGEITSCITVDLAGDYSVTVTTADGCVSTCSVTVVELPEVNCTITGELAICAGGSTELCVPDGLGEYLWSTGDTSNCTTVDIAGDFSVTITSDVGCVSTCSVLVTEEPLPLDAFICPPDLVIDCSESILAANTGTSVAIEYCGISATITFEDTETAGDCPQERIITRSWTATYENGPVISCVQIITVVDTVSPVILCAENVTIECGQDASPLAIGFATAIDNCTDSVSNFVHVDNVISGICINEYTIERTWTATDVCGNESQCIQTISVEGTTPPTITIVDPRIAPIGDTTLIQCYGQDPEWVIPEFDENSVIATGECSPDLTVEYSGELMEEGNCELDGYILLYRLTWTATDECGNSSSVSVIVALVDRIAPLIFGVPEDITVNCDEVPELPSQIYATDGCLCACVVMLEETPIQSACQDGQAIIRTWTASDRCGNTTVATQRITLVDNISPQIEMLQPELQGLQDGSIIEYSCNDGQYPNLFYSLNAQSVSIPEICGDAPEVNFRLTNSVDSDNCESAGYKEQLTAQWTAVDACGNRTSLTIFARLVDKEAPVFVGIPEMTCLGDPALQDIYAEDNCGKLYFHFWDMRIQSPCGNGAATLRTYEAYDDCGNRSAESVILIPNENISPIMEFVNPLLIGMETGDVIELVCDNQNGGYTSFGAEDIMVMGCSEGVKTTFTEKLIESRDCTRGQIFAILELQWTTTDVCGNIGVLTLEAQIFDNSGPEFTNFHSNVTIGCLASLPRYTVSDNCGDVTLTTSDSIVAGACEYEYVIHRELTATDYCGNVTTRFQTINVGDGTGPSIEGVVKVVCDDLTMPNVTAYDDCAGVFVPVTMEQDTIVDTCQTGMVIVRSWSAVNLCGNRSVVRQSIFMDDQTPPEIIIPWNSVIKYFENPGMHFVNSSESETLYLLSVLDKYSVFVSDECGQQITPQFTEEVFPGDCIEDGFSERRVYTWVATDICGNATTFTFTVHILDDIAPEMGSIPTDMLVACSDLPPVPPMLVDESAGETMAYYQTIVPGESMGEFEVTRTWVATDICGNEREVVQTIIWIPENTTQCELLVPDNVDCNTHGLIINSNVAGGNGPYTYIWEVQGEKCFIQSGQGTPSISMYVGWSQVKIILTITDANGCESMCMYILDCDFGIWQANASEYNSDAAERIKVQGMELSQDGNNSQDLTELTYWPNPTDGNLNLSFESSENHEVHIAFTNLLGQVVKSEQFDAKVGFNVHKTNIDYLDPGSYLMQVTIAKERHTKVIVVVK